MHTRRDRVESTDLLLLTHVPHGAGHFAEWQVRNEPSLQDGSSSVRVIGISETVRDYEATLEDSTYHFVPAQKAIMRKFPAKNRARAGRVVQERLRCAPVRFAVWCECRRYSYAKILRRLPQMFCHR